MITMNNRDALADIDDDILIADGFDEAIVGVAYAANDNVYVALYDLDKCLSILVQRDGMTLDEADEYFQFNVIRSLVYLGDRAPIFANLF